MRLVLNVIWLIFGGLWLAVGHSLAALVCVPVVSPTRSEWVRT